MKFETWLKRENLAESTIQHYLWTANYFNSHYPEVTKGNLLEYKDYLIQNYSPRTVNARILAINKYLMYLNKEKLKLKTVKIQQRSFLENVISHPDYIYFKRELRKLPDKKWYFAVWFMGATRARVSELIKFKVEMCTWDMLICTRKAVNSEEFTCQQSFKMKQLNGLNQKIAKVDFCF